jgi:hypothetical protein
LQNPLGERVNEVELDIAAADRVLLKEVLDTFPEAEVRIESGFGFVQTIGTLILPTAALAIKVAEFLYARKKDKSSNDEIVSIRYTKTNEYIEISAKGADEAEVMARLRSLSNIDTL